MRPEILYPLFQPVTRLPGVGPRIGKLIEKLAGARLVDLLWHLPGGLIDRRFAPPVAEAPDGAIATLTVKVEAHQAPPGRSGPRLPYKVICADSTGRIELVFFHARPDYLEKILPIGSERVVSGRVEHFRDQAQMPHPDHIVAPEELESLARVEAVYPLTAGLTSKPLTRAVAAALKAAPDLPEWIDPAYFARQGWPGWHTALLAAHAPEDEDDLAPTAPARMRLAFDELLAGQLAVALIRAQTRRLAGRALVGDGALRAKALAALPFQLTGSQTQAVDEILADMAAPRRMVRLLQGDVGSGKTVVAFLAMVAAVESGAQAALMVPTEILARQHFRVMAPLAEAVGLPIVLLTGRGRGKARREALDGLASGAVPLAVGTHALFQEAVAFRDLALAVVDEQHRFGVHQRLTLAAKGRAVDVLVMTATPIPRSLLLAAYGDLDSSRLTEKPAGRKPVDTRAVPLSRLDQIVAGVGRAVAEGARVFWVCPLVEESEKLDLAAAEDRHAVLVQQFGRRVGLVHGRMSGADKDAAMRAFAEGETDILVATTVIEVGVDVPEATVMVIEHAERFGLAQLHQLRGRIGRGARAGTCLLLYSAPLNETARARLKVLRETEDGFRIAEEDLRLRGAGEVLGTRQSGMPDFRLADLAVHADLLAAARDDARLILDRDPGLNGPRGEALRVLLYLFDRDSAIKYIRSG